MTALLVRPPHAGEHRPALASVARRTEAREAQRERLLALTGWVRQSARWWADALDAALALEGFVRDDRDQADAAFQGLPRWRGVGARGPLWLELQARCWREYGNDLVHSGLALELSALRSRTDGPAAALPRCLGVAFIYRCPLVTRPDEREMQESLLQLEPDQVLGWLRRHVSG